MNNGKQEMCRVAEDLSWQTHCTVVSAYNRPSFLPTSASVPLMEFPDCFSYPVHLKVSPFSPTGCKHKPASVLRNCPPKHAKIRL